MNKSHPIGVSDLGLVTALVAGTIVAVLVPGVPQSLEWVFGIPFLLVLPGYVVVAALFPAAPTIDRTPTGQPDAPGWAVRAGMTIFSSVILVAIVGTLLSLVGLLELVPVIFTLSVVTLVGARIARLRRNVLAVDRPADPIARFDSTRIGDVTGLTGLQRFTFAISVLALIGVVAFVAGTPAAGTPYTEATLLGDDGETLLGANGTVTLEAGVPNPMTLQLENQENSQVTYEIVGQLQRVGPNGSVLETAIVDQGQVQLADGEAVSLERTIDPPLTGDALRVRYLIYKGSLPEDPTGANASLVLRQSVAVSGGGSA